MKKVIFNIIITVVAFALVSQLFYIGYMEATVPGWRMGFNDNGWFDKTEPGEEELIIDEPTDEPVTQFIEPTTEEVSKETIVEKETETALFTTESDGWIEDETPVEMAAGDFLISESGDEAVFVKYSGKDVCVILPSKYKGKPITSIAEGAFTSASCKVVVIPDSYTIISNNAFVDNTSIEKVKIGDGVTEISNMAFGYCKNLTTVTGGINVKTIKPYAFAGCAKLETIDFDLNNIEIGSKAFDKTQIKV
jgi:hypothetical protein